MPHHTYLFYDTVHLIKNVRNNLAKSHGFSIPPFQYTINDRSEDVVEGSVSWKMFHQLRERDGKCMRHLRKAPHLTSNVIHFTNNKQSVKLALALFDEKTIAAFESYFTEKRSQVTFLKL